VDEFIRVCLKLFAAFVVSLVCPAGGASAVFPLVLDAPKADVALRIIEGGADRVFPVGDFGAVQGAARHQTGELCDANPEELVLHDVVDALLPIGDLRFQPLVEPPGDLAQEHAGLAGWVEKSGFWIAPEFLRQEIQHLVG